jgi:hypothetical protein
MSRDQSKQGGVEMGDKKYIDLFPNLKSEEITAEEYLERKKAGKISAKNVEILPPKLGSSGFGKFKVKRVVYSS